MDKQLTNNEAVVLKMVSELPDGKGWLISKSEHVEIWNACVSLRSAGLVTWTKTTYGPSNRQKTGWIVAKA